MSRVERADKIAEILKDEYPCVKIGEPQEILVADETDTTLRIKCNGLTRKVRTKYGDICRTPTRDNTLGCQLKNLAWGTETKP